MEKHQYDNWMKVKTALEAAGKTDCHFYKRAATIAKTGRDPVEDVTFNARNKLS